MDSATATGTGDPPPSYNNVMASDKKQEIQFIHNNADRIYRQLNSELKLDDSTIKKIGQRLTELADPIKVSLAKSVLNKPNITNTAQNLLSALNLKLDVDGGKYMNNILREDIDLMDLASELYKEDIILIGEKNGLSSFELSHVFYDASSLKDAMFTVLLKLKNAGKFTNITLKDFIANL